MSHLQCIKAVKDLMNLTLREAKEVLDSKMPYVIEVHDDEKLETFVSYTKEYCSSMEYTIEDVTMSRTELVEYFTNAINNVREAFSMLISQNDEVGDRYNKVCAEANMLQAEVEKLKANNNNDLCIQLREEIASLKRDYEFLRENNKVVVTKNDNLTEANKCLEDLVDQLNKEKENLELENKRLRDTNQKLGVKLAAIKEVVIKTKGKYYNAVFQHIGWEHAQQLLTLAKQLNIEFGQIKPE